MQSMSENNYSVNLYPAALRDMDSIYTYYYIESQEVAIAEKVIKKLWDAMRSLSFMPASHSPIREKRLKKDGFRKLICGEYIIPFLIDEEHKTVSVVRVFHGKMNYQKYL